MPEWKVAAAEMAAEITPGGSRWRREFQEIPRHEFVPAWWRSVEGGWACCDGRADLDHWIATAYRDASVITRIDGLHADHAQAGEFIRGGRPTSSSTHPGLLLQMYRHAQLADGLDVLDVGTGSGYGTALLAAHQGDTRITSVDIDPYLVKAARARLGDLGIRSSVHPLDATHEVPAGTYDRIIATVAVSPIPAVWLKRLRPGGRIVTVLDGTRAIFTADKHDDGVVRGRIERDWAGFMSVRHGDQYPPEIGEDRLQEMLTGRGTHAIEQGTYPLANVDDAWELSSMLTITYPGIRWHWQRGDDGQAALLLWDDEDSWARAEGPHGAAPQVYADGPVNLHRILERIKQRWLIEGSLPLYGARAEVDPDGTIHLCRGRWNAAIEHR